MLPGNHGEVLDQLRAAGLQVAQLEIGRLIRCRVKDDRERRGWYLLHELQGRDGRLLIVGSFGVWRGTDNGARKIALRSQAFSAEQREAIRKRLQTDRRYAERQRAEQAARAARRAAKVWAQCSEQGDAPYLARKGVGAFGVRFTPSGALVVPLLDTAGTIHGLQFIHPRPRNGRDKDFWPAGLVKKGHFHLIGTPLTLVLVAEGYATAATLHQATGLPVAVAFDAGNLGPVARELRRRYKLVKILLCADDDCFGECVHCGTRVDLSRWTLVSLSSLS